MVLQNSARTKAAIKLFAGRQGPSESMKPKPSAQSFEGSQLSGKTYLRALNCNARLNTKKVGSASIGAIHLDLSIGSSVSRIIVFIM